MDKYNVNDEVTDKYSLRGRVFNKIREDILKGVYNEKEPIIETKISEELGVSRTPVREAIRQLELEGLITVIPNKGAVVSGINKKDIEDIYEIRALIEGLSAKWATMHINQEQIDELEEMIYLSKFYLDKNHIDQLYLLDTKFHERIYEISKSRILKHVLSDFHHYVQRVRYESLSSPERARNSIKEHEAILVAIKAKDYDLVEKLTNKHIKNTQKNIVERVIIND